MDRRERCIRLPQHVAQLDNSVVLVHDGQLVVSLTEGVDLAQAYADNAALALSRIAPPCRHLRLLRLQLRLLQPLHRRRPLRPLQSVEEDDAQHTCLPLAPPAGPPPEVVANCAPEANTFFGPKARQKSSPSEDAEEEKKQ